MNIRNMRLDEVHIGTRRREELGDLAALAASIQQYGLIHLIVIDHKGTLVAGQRRLEACQLLGWTEIEVRVYDELIEQEHRAIELEEKLRRKDLTPHEHSKELVQKAETMAQCSRSVFLPRWEKKIHAAGKPSTAYPRLSWRRR